MDQVFLWFLHIRMGTLHETFRAGIWILLVLCIISSIRVERDNMPSENRIQKEVGIEKKTGAQKLTLVEPRRSRGGFKTRNTKTPICQVEPKPV